LLAKTELPTLLPHPINTPPELAINNQIDRFSIAIDVIVRVPKLKVADVHAK
jgi:xylulose-5-phosphate/fructose-6-phosphate phosphoketolase